MMRLALVVIAIGTLIVAAGSNAVAKPGERERRCSKEMKSPAGGRVIVSFIFKMDGTPLGREVLWLPPQPDGILTLGVSYRAPTESGVGEPAAVEAAASSENVPSFLGYPMELRNGSGSWTANIAKSRDTPVPPGHVPAYQYSIGFAVIASAESGRNRVLLERLDALGPSTLALVESPLGPQQTTVDLGARAGRDALFAATWSKVVRASRNPMHCTPTRRAPP